MSSSCVFCFGCIFLIADAANAQRRFNHLQDLVATLAFVYGSARLVGQALRVAMRICDSALGKCFGGFAAFVDSSFGNGLQQRCGCEDGLVQKLPAEIQK